MCPVCAVHCACLYMLGGAWRVRRGLSGSAQAVQCFRAKVGYDNEGSQALFRRLAFQEVARVEVFREVTLEWCLTAEGRERLQRQWHVTSKTAYNEQATDT